MRTPHHGHAPKSAAAPISSIAEGQQLISHLAGVMDAMLKLVEEETRLVRAGRLTDSAQLAAPKSDLSRLYLSDTEIIKASKSYLSQNLPDEIDMLRRRHDTFHAVLQINLTVLATAHAVSEGIMRGVSNELTRKASPQTYGASGHASAPKRQMAPPLTVSRVL